MNDLTPTEPREPTGPPDVPWTTRDVWLGIGLLGLAFGGVVLVLLGRPNLDLGLVVSLGELVMLLPVGIIAVWKYRAGWETLGFRPFSWPAIRLAIYLLIVAYLVNGLYAAVLAMFGLRVQADLAPILARLSTPWWFVAGAAVVAPLVEETFFRGFVFAGFRRRYGWRRAAVVTSIMFALVHGEWTAFLPIFVLGMILTYLYQRSRSLWPGILFHVTNNAVTVAVLYLAMRMGLDI